MTVFAEHAKESYLILTSINMFILFILRAATWQAEFEELYHCKRGHSPYDRHGQASRAPGR